MFSSHMKTFSQTGVVEEVLQLSGCWWTCDSAFRPSVQQTVQTGPNWCRYKSCNAFFKIALSLKIDWQARLFPFGCGTHISWSSVDTYNLILNTKRMSHHHRNMLVHFLHVMMLCVQFVMSHHSWYKRVSTPTSL